MAKYRKTVKLQTLDQIRWKLVGMLFDPLISDWVCVQILII